MAYGDSILDAAIKTYQPIESTQDTLQAAQGLQMGSLKLKAAQGDLEQQQMDLAASRELTPLQVALKKAQAKNSLFSNAIATAPDADTWDANMRALADKGVPEAEQYIGRYSPVLQQRLQSVYGGQQQTPVGMSTDAAGLDQAGAGTAGKGAGGASAAGGLDYQFAQTTPEQRAQALQRISAISQGLEQVKDPQTWNALKAQLAQAGMPGMDQLGDYSPIKAASIYSRIQPVLSYLQNRAIADQAGIPKPKAAPDIKESSGQLWSVDPYNGTARPITPRNPEYQATTDAMGQPMIFDKTTGKMTPPVANDGVFGFDDFAHRMAQAENNTGDRTAQNPNSSATGDGQFIKSTWLKTVKTARPELAHMSDDDLLQLRKDPAFSLEMTAENAKANAGVLQQNGQPVNATSLALAHRFGPTAALSVLGADPNAKMSSILPADVIKANPQLANQTAGDYVSKLGKQVGMDPIGAPSQSAPTGGELLQKIQSAKSRDEAISYVPQNIRGTVKSMLEGRMSPPTGMALKTPYWQNLMNIANTIDPSFDQVTWTGRLNANKDMQSGGKSKTLLNSGETAIAHLYHLAAQIPSVSGVALPFVGDPLNSVINKAEQPYTGGLNSYNDTLGHLGEETTKFYRGTGGSEADVDRTLKNLAPNLSTTAKQSGVKNTVGLIYGRLLPMVETYNKTMGTNYPASHFVSPRTVKMVRNMGFDPDTGEKLSSQQQPAGAPPTMSAQDQQAIAWANANPKDPRAVQIKAKLGM